MENDLRQPLKRRSVWARLLSSRPSALRTASFASIAALCALGGWLVFTHEPYGGEPVVHMRIDTSDPIMTSSLSKPSGNQNTAAAEEEQSDPVETGADTPVIDLSELGSRSEDGSENDLQRRKRELINPQADVESPSNALSIDDLAHSRDDQGGYQQAAIAPHTRISLAPAPVAKVTGNGPHGALPKRAKDGTSPASIYARPVPDEQLASDLPKVALLIGGMGLNPRLTQTAIETLPPEVSLAFAPYGEDLQGQANTARARGHELFVQLPMEPFGYPSIDPGPKTLLTSVSPDQNIDSLYWLLSRFTGYAGVTNYLGAQFASNDKAMTPVLKELGKRGLVYIDDGSKGLSQVTRLARSQGLDARSAVINLDEGSPEAALQQLEALARQNGFAIATGSGLPGTIEAINQWSQGLAGREIILVPVSAAFSARRS